MTYGTAPPAAAQAAAGRDLRALPAPTLLASIAFVLADRQRLRRSGVAAGGLPSAWWSLLPPVYLWRRAAALGGSRALFWAWFASTAAASAVQVAVLAALAAQAAEERAAAGRLPDCASRDIVADLRAVFDDLPAARLAGVRAVSLGGQAEVAQGPGPVPTVRYCSGTMLATDDVDYDVDFSFERRQEDVIVRMRFHAER